MSTISVFVVLTFWLLRVAAAANTSASFDYIVIGGGTAGVSIASRLSQQSERVALVEAGTYYQQSWPLQAIPGADTLPVGSDPDATYPPADWSFVTTPQAGAKNRKIHFARGKCLGGSSALNFMIYQRPTTQSMHQWATEVNDTDYCFENILPFYKKSTAFTPPNVTRRSANATAQYDTSAFNQDGGPLRVSYANYAMPFSSWMELGMKAIGLEEAQDFNSGKLKGYQYCSSTLNPSNGRRESSQTAFLPGNLPSHLKLYKNTLAKRILFDNAKNAIGVEVQNQLGVKHNMTASKEIILSAGAFQSPQLLMVSGIGPADILNKHHIPIVSKLAGVGQNMWDHPFFGPTYRVNMNTFTRVANDLTYLVGQFLAFETQQSGPMANPVADFLGWEKIPQELRSSFSSSTQQSLAQFPDDWPEAEYISGAGYIGNFSNLFTTQPKDGYQYASMLGVMITPTSRGNVSISSADAATPPIINPNWLTTESDQQLAVAMFKRMRQAFQSSAMAPLIRGEEYNPGPAVKTDGQILEYIRETVMTLWHPAGTCKMGTSDDPEAVIDSQARVFGVSRLRVVDASSFPFLPPGHPSSTVYMLAEKIAADILGKD